jgi:enoyl-CoA hydratase/carnithine racemase
MTDVGKPITLKALAEHLGLSKTTISMVLNNAPGARTIASATKQRVQEAAERFKYRPNVHAHMLGSRQRVSEGGDVVEEHGTTRLFGMEDQTRRVFELEQENARLKRLVAELCLDKTARGI